MTAYLRFIVLACVSLFLASGHGEITGGIDSRSGTIVLALSQEPRSLNTLTAESVSYTAQLLVHLQEGLLRYDRRGRLAGGVASRWTMDDSRMVFHLRDNARWQNGEPVTADDFVFAWRQLVDPETASPSATLASPIRNAERILRGDLPATELGVRAVDGQALEVELEHPCSWCLKLMTSSIFYPVNRKFYESHRADYGTTPASHLSNGAFELGVWQRGKRIELHKNRLYWNQEQIRIRIIRFDTIGSDAKTRFNLFRAGALAATGLNRETVAEALEQGYRVKTYPTGHLFNIQFSHLPGMKSANRNLRMAISLVIDKDELVNRIVATPGTRVADSLFHDWLKVGETRFLQARPPTPHKVNAEAARRHLQLARKELGLDENAPLDLVLTINDSGLYRRIAEYLQQRLAALLDIRLSIDPQMTQMMVEKWRAGTSDMTLITWPVDVDDPMDQISFMGNPAFRTVFQGLYRGEDMAALYYRNRDATSMEERLDAVEAVQRFFESRVTVLPLFELYGAVVVNPKLKGFVWQPVRGYADYRYARIIQ